MFLKVRKWVTLFCAFLFILSASFMAFNIEGKMKNLSIKKTDEESNETKNVGKSDHSTTVEMEFIATETSSTQLSKCKVWMLASQSLMSDDFWRCSVESALAQTNQDHPWNQEDDYEGDESNMKRSVCLISDRFAQPHLNLSSPNSNWIWSLQDKYGKERLLITAPDYAAVFSGTLFEELYINSRDMSFLGAALIWSLIWKYGGLFVHQDTLLLLSLKSYYNFVVLNTYGNGSSLALFQLESQHSLSMNALHHLMEQLQRRSAYQTFFPYHHNYNHRSPSHAMPTLRPLSDKDWSQEVETYCGKKLSKEMAGKFCQDTEVVDSESLPRLSDKKTVKQWIRNVGSSPYIGRTLAIQVNLSDGGKKSLLQDRHVRKWLRSICPIMFHMQ